MTDPVSFGLAVLLGAGVVLAAILSSRVSARLHVPAPALFLAASAAAAALAPGLEAPSQRSVEHLVSLALVLILFDGGMHIGWARFRSAAVPIAVAGVAGTFLTTAAVAALGHYAFDLPWFLALLLGASVAPTDPAVVFSVLGGQQLSGRSGTILEGESGANDPVGIALVASLLAAGGVSAGAFGHVAAEFALQMAVGGAVGLAGGRALLWLMRAAPLPSAGLSPLRSLAGCLLVFGLATACHGSGFLAVFVAGIAVGDATLPHKVAVTGFHSSLASLGEIVAFVALGLTVDVEVLSRASVWVPGLVVAALLAAVIRPLLIGLCLAGVSLRRNERAFVLGAGLKGAVPLLLGSLVLAGGVAQAERLYGIVVVVVAASVVVQGSLVPIAVRALRLGAQENADAARLPARGAQR